jgi:chromosome segregation ATPase
MDEIEKLDPETRKELSEIHEGLFALRIIEQQAVALVALRERVDAFLLVWDLDEDEAEDLDPTVDALRFDAPTAAEPLTAADQAIHEAVEERKDWEQQHGVQWERAEAAEARCRELEAERDAYLKTAASNQRENVELVTERAQMRERVTKATEILSTPGMWSDFAKRALEVLRG